MPYTPSPLRYPGGKTKIYKFVRTLIDINGLSGQTYIEPFAGGAGLAIKLLQNGDVKRIVLNDFDYAIYAFWYSLLNYTEELCHYIRDTKVCTNEWAKQKAVYNDQESHTILEVGLATLFLNRTNVSGVLKGGIIGGLSQDGDYKIDARFNKQELVAKVQSIAAQKEYIDIYHLDAIEFLRPTVLGHYYKAFINFDPPYVDKGGQLYKNSYLPEDHRILRDAISNCTRKWMVTYDVCPLINQLYGNFRGSYVDIYYSANNVRKAKEYIFFSNNMVIPDNIELI